MKLKIIILIISLLCIQFVLSANYGTGNYGEGIFGEGYVNTKSSEEGFTHHHSPYIYVDYCAKILKNQSHYFEIKDYLAIRGVNITAKKNLLFPLVVAEWLYNKDLQKEVPILLKQNVYHYEKIDLRNFGDSQIQKAKIKFRVEKKWLKDNNLQIEDIVLKRYTKDWVELNTTYLGEESDYYYFESETEGLNYFAIAAKSTINIPELKRDNYSTEKNSPNEWWKKVLIVFVFGFIIIIYLIYYKNKKLNK